MQNDNPTDLRQQAAVREERTREEQLKRETELSDFRWLMSDKRGRRFVWRLLGIARVFSLTFRESSKEQDFLEGMRNVGVILIGDAHEHCLTLYHLMERENASNAKRRTDSR
jgi:hypothetical protein